MRKMLAAAAVITMLGAGVAVAQPMGPGPMGGGPTGYMHDGHGPWAHDPAARLEHLKKQLGIRPDQEPAWDAYAKAVRDNAAEMRKLHQSVDFENLRAMPWTDVQATMGKLHDQEAATFRAEQAAATRLIASLDDGQKTQALLPMLLHAEHGPGRHGDFGPDFRMMHWDGDGAGR